MAGRRVRGDRSFRRILNKLSDGGEIRKEVYERLDKLGSELLQEQEVAGRFQSRTGALRSGLSKRITPKSLVLKVGLIGKPINRRLFYGYFIEWGRKGGGRGVKRGSAKYNRGVGKTAADNFVHGSQQSATIKQSVDKFRDFWHSVLMKASAGVSDD